MESSQLTNSEHPSVSSLRGNPCLEIDPTIAALNAVADDGISYLLSYAHFLYAERSSNPALEREPEAPPEKMLIHFACGTVAVLGSGLKKLERALQGYELKYVKSADRRLAATLNTHVAALAVTLTRKLP